MTVATLEKAAVLAERKFQQVVALNKAFANRNQKVVAFLERGGNEAELHPYAKKKLLEHRRIVQRLIAQANALKRFAEKQGTIF